MQILYNDSIPIGLWREFLSDNPYASPFQTPEFYEIFNSVSQLSATAIAIRDSKSLVALTVITLQKEKGIIGHFSKRAIIYGGPLFANGNTNALKILLDEISYIYKGKAIYVEIRNLFNYYKFREVFINSGWYYEPHLNFRVNCESEEIIWKNLNRLRKRQIKKAINNNVVIKEADNINEVKDMFHLLEHTYKNRIRKPLFEWDFFRLFFEKKFGKIFLVKNNDKVIGGHFCPLGDKVIYDWYGCGLDREFRDLAPSTMAVYAALTHGASTGHKYLDFMGAGSPNEDYGVRDFKAQFGGELVEYGRYLMILNPILFKQGKIWISIISGSMKL